MKILIKDFFSKCDQIRSFLWKELMNAFLKAQLNYCPLVWIFHSHKLNNKIK